MSALELHHFVPKSRTSFADMFHRAFPAALYTKQADLRELVCDRFGVTAVDNPRDILSPDAQQQLFILHQGRGSQDE